MYGRSFDDEEMSIEKIDGPICEVTIKGKELEHDGVCEISDRKHNDSLFVSDFAGFNRKNLALYCNLTDRTVNLFNGHLFIIKASSIHDISDLSKSSIVGLKKITDFTSKREDTDAEKRVELH